MNSAVSLSATMNMLPAEKLESKLGLVENRIEPGALCHCSGDKARKLFKDCFGENYLDCGIGREIVIRLDSAHGMKGR